MNNDNKIRIEWIPSAQQRQSPSPRRFPFSGFTKTIKPLRWPGPLGMSSGLLIASSLSLALALAPQAYAGDYDDSDGDGIIDMYDPNPNDGPLGDLDYDGVDNFTESCFGTDPENPDTDGDSVPDGEELYGGTPLELCANPLDTDGDGIPDVFDTDDDNDGIPTRLEAGNAGLAAGNDGSSWDDPDNDGLPNYRDTDSDNDGKPDSDEWSIQRDFEVFTPEQFYDFRRKLLKTSFDFRMRLGVIEFADRDSDGIPDHLDAWDEDGPTGDPDGDGLSNMLEKFIGSDPFSPDTDGDGRWDNEEIADIDGDGDYDLVDFDGDGVLDIFDPDDDGDGAPTFFERSDADGDGEPDYHDTDSYGVYEPQEDAPTCVEGMIPDGSEGQEYCVDRDCDGIVDAEESTQEYYVDATTAWEVFYEAFFKGNKRPAKTPPGSTRPSLYDGACALKDYDCDGVANYIDPDWTDGPGENGEGDPMCKYFQLQ